MAQEGDRWRKWIHRKTAAVCQDYPAPDAPHEPSSRAALRFFVTMVAVLAGIGAIIYAYTTSVEWRTIRHWGTDYLLSLPTSKPNDPQLLCPCDKPAIAWPYYVSFVWINQSQNQPGSWNRFTITNYTQFCDPLLADNQTSGVWRQGCYSMGQYLTGFTNETMMTTLSTNTVTAPSALAQMIAIEMENVASHVMTDYSYISTNNYSDWVQLYKVKQMFSSAGSRLSYSTRFIGDENRTNAAYWRFYRGLNYMSSPRGGKTKAFHLTGNRALVVEMDWRKYVEQCTPPYCDEVARMKSPERFLGAAISVGGFAAVMMVVLRGLVWPCILHVNHWP